MSFRIRGVTGMAIYHFDRNGVSPAAGSSAVKASAYISGATVFRELTASIPDPACREALVRLWRTLADHEPG